MNRLNRSARRLVVGALLVAFGVVLGVVISVGSYIWAHRSTEVWRARGHLVAAGISIPKGTELIHDSAMSEGFDTLILYVNVSGGDRSQFEIRRDPRSFLVIPYWVGQPSADKAAK